MAFACCVNVYMMSVHSTAHEHEQQVRRTVIALTLSHTITAYSVSGNVVRVRILICATRQSRVEKEFASSIVVNLTVYPP